MNLYYKYANRKIREGLAVVSKLVSALVSKIYVSNEGKMWHFWGK